MPEKMGASYLVINDEIQVTVNHPLFVNGGWTSAGDVRVGDRLFSLNGEDVPVVSIEKIFSQVPTFNLEIGMYHTYFANHVLVHNKPLPYELVHRADGPEGL